MRRLLERGPAVLEDWELIHVLANASICREKPDVGKAMLRQFDGLGGLSRALPEEMVEAAGVDRASAARLAAAGEFARRAAAQPKPALSAINGPSDVAALVRASVGDAMAETFHVLLLDTRHRVRHHEIVARGTLSQCLLDPRAVFRSAVRRGAACVLIAHNHPSGDPTPSPEDMQVTRRMAAAGEVLGIELLDHVVVGEVGEGPGYVSFREMDLMKPAATR